ncbi:hypothetical protein AB0H83_21385 [Dactylosporangium sp. NPDC050688]|uniref:hypothetical protein n=1 Tax=Dactylosporangium sp. NPDC050688 TaxID=3157217 RepID=UPI0033DCE95E
MAIMAVRNDSAGWLVLWLEPLGEDFWLRPAETFQNRSPYAGAELECIVNYWVNDDDRAAGIGTVTMWIQNRDPFEVVVTDGRGAVVECGHGRPVEIAEKWAAQREQGQTQVDDRESNDGP